MTIHYSHTAHLIAAKANMVFTEVLAVWKGSTQILKSIQQKYQLWEKGNDTIDRQGDCIIQ